MNRAIRYYYNITIDQELPKQEITSFNFNNEVYYFVVFDRGKRAIVEIMNCINELERFGIYCHRIIVNRFGSALSLVDNKNYVLMKIRLNPNEMVDFSDIVSDSSKLVLGAPLSKRFNNNWGLLWQKKVDYLENQIRQLGKDKIGVINSFSYYDGLAENAIIYFENTNKSLPATYNVCLSHRRIFSPNIWLNYGNPLSFLIDLDVRDIAEYFKYHFFYSDGDDLYNDFDYFLKTKKMSNYSFQMLMARLLFPTYYFDLVEKILLEGVEEDSLIPILTKSREYEKFLRYCFNQISIICPISNIPEWIS